MFALFAAAAALSGWPVGALLFRSGGYGDIRTLGRAFGGLGGIRAKDFILERGTVEAANDRLHFIRCGCFHESEALGLLGFVVPDYLNRTQTGKLPRKTVKLIQFVVFSPE